MNLEEDPIIEMLKVIKFISDTEYEDSEFFNNILQDKPVELDDEVFMHQL